MAVEGHVPPRPPTAAQRLATMLSRRVQGAEAVQLGAFTQTLLARGGGYVATLAEDEQAAMVWSAFRFFAAPGPEIRVRVLNPTYVTEGWDSPVTVLETSMPDRAFIVDTVRAELEAQGLEPRTLLHPIFAARRDLAGGLAALAAPFGDERHESFLHVGLGRVADPERLDRIAADMRARLEDVQFVTDDFAGMVARAQALSAEYERLARGRTGPLALEGGSVAEFLRWLVDGAFVFLGYREYVVGAGGAGIQMRSGSGLGLLRKEERSALRHAIPAAELSPRVREWLAGPRLISVGKTKAVSPVHRRAHMDEIAVKEFDPSGRVIGERRFLGLLTSKAYAEEAAEVPLLRQLLRQILAAERVVSGSYDHKAIVEIFNTMPKADLLASQLGEIRADLQTVLAANQIDDVVITVRPGVDRLVVLTVMPEDRFSGEARLRIEEDLVGLIGAELLDTHLQVGLGGRARLHLTFVAPATPPDGELIETICARIRALLSTWEEGFREALRMRCGETGGARLAARYGPALPADYRAATPLDRVLEDVAGFEAALAAGTMHVTLAAEGSGVRLRLYVPGDPVALADFLPVIEHLGLRALSEDQVAVPITEPRQAVYLQRFDVQDLQGGPLALGDRAALVVEALGAVREGRAEDDLLGRLVLTAGLSWHDVAVLRTYVGYVAQTGVASRAVALATLAAHPRPARLLFDGFAARFRPGGAVGDPRAAFLESLEGVTSLREDTILRAVAEAIEATVRTNAFVEPVPPQIAIKVRGEVSWLPRPRPLFEIHVHAPQVEGVHLRAGAVARGGIRASDRPEDLRTEVLGLMRTQVVKNAVIVPTGAKGGFVVRGRAGRPVERSEVVAAYKLFIGGLLELTDTLVGGKVVPPGTLVVLDGEDPYLVVAADKGTASFSDIANGLAEERGFWLGDAFASGGSSGYDHKALGITARGAWECVRAHFHGMGLNADQEPLTVVGIGDPGGDVFGNGLLRSPHLRLLAAFNHLHIFLDPEPDPARSFAERERLYRQGRGWDGYDATVLSPGGMIVPRAAKRVELPAEVRVLLGTDATALSGEALVRAVLGLKVDLLFNGGVGTYVKAAAETHAEVGDPANDTVRVDAETLRARVVCEGGNLGFTPWARVEFALQGGCINSDAVDNSAGVDMSDHEVNLKICLAPEIGAGTLTRADRDALLVAVREDVVARVLAHNARQARVLGVDQLRSRTAPEEFLEHQLALEAGAGLDRAQAALPDREALHARRAGFLGFTRPELAAVMAFTKIQLRTALLASTVPDDPLFAAILVEYFPTEVVQRFPAAVQAHRLRREIVAAELAGLLVDRVGATFVHRVCRDAAAEAAAAVRAWGIAWELIGGERLTRAIQQTDVTAEAETTCQLLLERVAEGTTRWLLANAVGDRPAAGQVEELAGPLATAREQRNDWLVGSEAESHRRRITELEIAGIPTALAQELASAVGVPALLDVIEVARGDGLELAVAGTRYHRLAQDVDFDWIVGRLLAAAGEDDWQRRAAGGFVADVLLARRLLARCPSPPTAGLLGVQALVREIAAMGRVPVAALAVVAQELRRLAERSREEAAR